MTILKVNCENSHSTTRSFVITNNNAHNESNIRALLLPLFLASENGNKRSTSNYSPMQRYSSSLYNSNVYGSSYGHGPTPLNRADSILGYRYPGFIQQNHIQIQKCPI